ncbi:hypothetical protein [Acidocella aromatica]|uniref:Lipoprotein n=1 Tax=Acidocella aromatica TaxID=1303579 RepID=A0A840V8J4_9PROT|nr:hypothetical protein [Acidocella aromatica]MBB5372033.1 hypothetical protein [Acidocella aromatica]
MAIMGMKISSRAMARIAAIALAGASLAGCVYYPSGYGYYAQPAYVAPPVVVGGWWGWGDDWGEHGHWR